jgi:hypothetical protein
LCPNNNKKRMEGVWRGYSAPRCILCGGCTQPVFMGWFDPAPRTTEPKPAPDNRIVHDLTRNWSGWETLMGDHRCSSTAPPQLQPDGRQWHEATGRHDATLAPTSSILISTWDADTERWDAMMEQLPPPGLPWFQSAVPHLQFQLAIVRYPVTTGNGSSFDFNQRRPQALISTTVPKFWFQLMAARDPITTSGGSALIPSGGGPGSNFNLKI